LRNFTAGPLDPEAIAKEEEDMGESDDDEDLQ
jgi:hypothetical protein